MSTAAATERKAAARSARDFVDAHRSDESAELYGITELCREFGISGCQIVVGGENMAPLAEQCPQKHGR